MALLANKAAFRGSREGRNLGSRTLFKPVHPILHDNFLFFSRSSPCLNILLLGRNPFALYLFNQDKTLPKFSTPLPILYRAPSCYGRGSRPRHPPPCPGQTALPFRAPPSSSPFPLLTELLCPLDRRIGVSTCSGSLSVLVP